MVCHPDGLLLPTSFDNPSALGVIKQQEQSAMIAHLLRGRDYPNALCKAGERPRPPAGGTLKREKGKKGKSSKRQIRIREKNRKRMRGCERVRRQRTGAAVSGCMEAE